MNILVIYPTSVGPKHEIFEDIKTWVPSEYLSIYRENPVVNLAAGSDEIALLLVATFKDWIAIKVLDKEKEK